MQRLPRVRAPCGRRLSVSASASAPAHPPLRSLGRVPILGSLPFLPIKPSEMTTSTYTLWKKLGQLHGPFFRGHFPSMGEVHIIEDPFEMTKVMQMEGSYPNGVIQQQWPLYRAARETLGWSVGGTKDSKDHGFWGQGEHWRRLRMFLQTDMLAPAAAKGYAAALVTAAALASKGAPASGDDLERWAAQGPVATFSHAANERRHGKPRFAARCTFDLFHAVMFGHMTRLAGGPESERAQENVICYQVRFASWHAMAPLHDLSCRLRCPFYGAIEYTGVVPVYASDVFAGLCAYMQQNCSLNSARPSPQETMAVFDMLMPLTSFNTREVILGKWLGLTTPMYAKFKVHLSKVDEINRCKIDRFVERKAAGELNEHEANSYIARAIDRQAAAAGSPSSVSIKETKELCSTALLAAVDTTSSVLNWCLLHIALNPKVQDALAGEVAREGICANKLGSRAAYPYLHATLREAHRLTPAAPINLVKKNLQGPVTVHGREFPPGTTFILNTYFPGHDPERVPEPNIFDPERFLPPAEAARKGTPAAILDHTLYRAPFSAGARQCPGSRVAMLEVQALLLTFIRDWKIEPVDPSITWDKVWLSTSCALCTSCNSVHERSMDTRDALAMVAYGPHLWCRFCCRALPPHFFMRCQRFLRRRDLSPSRNPKDLHHRFWQVSYFQGTLVQPHMPTLRFTSRN